ncbi:MAG: hypothetical protein OEY38_12740 [Gammaproteobacteria bacterium]|nr:hypothetical protein [Gammaproteobacteria bacterium]
MSIHIYLDHNILDHIKKGDFSLGPSGEIIWIYSDENLGEIRRSGNEFGFLEVLDSIKARKLDLVLDENFRITGSAQILEYKSPHEEYQLYLDAVSECNLDHSSDFEILARLYGANNRDKILSHPDTVEKAIKEMLEPYGLFSEEIKGELKKVTLEIGDFVSGPLQELTDLETSRATIGTHNGRAGNIVSEENPIEHLWEIVKFRLGEMTPDQFFGFDPMEKQGYEEWPMYLGIISCHNVLNVLGFRPDDGLTKPEKLPGVLSDASHIAYAAYCQGLLSKDRKMLAKAKAIYRYKNISTKVLTIQ